MARRADPGAHFTPGVWTAYGPALTAPIDRIHGAGAECSPIWNGYMEGAVRSVEATAVAVDALLPPDSVATALDRAAMLSDVADLLPRAL